MTKIWKILSISLGVIILLDTIYLLNLWPDWKKIGSGPIPESIFIKNYRDKLKSSNKLPPLRWSPKSSSIPKEVSLPFIVAEDSRFYTHGGIDFKALADAMRYNLSRQKMVLGASTISQQTSKNLFLSPSRDLLRKWHELILTRSMESNLSKTRILKIYLNIAEFGLGIYGIHAASSYYFSKTIYELSTEEISALAATLPSPKKHNPRSNSSFFNGKKKKILAAMNRYYKNSLRVDESADDPELNELPDLSPEPSPEPSPELSPEPSSELYP